MRFKPPSDTLQFWCLCVCVGPSVGEFATALLLLFSIGIHKWFGWTITVPPKKAVFFSGINQFAWMCDIIFCTEVVKANQKAIYSIKKDLLNFHNVPIFFVKIKK